MPREIFIKGCGLMACSSYAEIAAAMDRAYAVAPQQPLPMDEVFAALAAPVSPERLTDKNLPLALSPAPAPEPC